MKLRKWIAAMLALATVLGLCTAALAVDKNAEFSVKVGEKLSEKVIYTPKGSIYNIKRVSGALPDGLSYAYDSTRLYVFGTPAGGSVTSTVVFSITEMQNGKRVDNYATLTCKVWITYPMVPAVTAPPTAPPSGTPKPIVTITKHPTGEVVEEGGSCKFIAHADGAVKREWWFVRPDGKKEYKYNKLSSQLPGLKVSGGTKDTLKLSEIPYEANGWSVCCRFYIDDKEYVTTDAAKIRVVAAEEPAEVTPVPVTPAPVTPAPAAVPAAKDYTKMTNGELLTEINRIRAELTRREALAQGDAVIANADGVLLTLSGQPEIVEQLGVKYLSFPVTAVNTATAVRGLVAESIYVNGWKVNCDFIVRLDAGTRAKDAILIPDAEKSAEIADIRDLQDVKLTLYTFDPSTYITLTSGIEAALTFGK